MASVEKDHTVHSLMEAGEKANISVSSSSSSDSQGFTKQKKGLSKSSLFKYGSKGKLEKRRHKKWKKNKIGKEDFYNKTTEFRCWLMEKNKLELDKMDKDHAKAMFKKFVKHWNKRKLDEKYYDNLAAWATASPSVYAKVSAPEVSAERAQEKVKAETFTPLYDQDFSTFGKRAGKKALRELQRMEGATPTQTGEVIYAVPMRKNKQSSSVDDSSDDVPPGYATPIPPRPALAKLFDDPELGKGEGETSESDHSFASVRRQRPLSCHGRVQKVLKQPSVPVIPTLNGSSESSTNVEMRCPTSRAPRPHTEYPSSNSSALGLRRKARSTTSNSSTDSEASTTSLSSSVSSLSSYAPSTASDADYGSLYGSRTSINRDPAFRPKPPLRSSSISKHSKKLREVAKAVIAKQAASPMKPETPLNQRRMGFKSGITACANATPSPPPPPPPPSDPKSIDLDDSVILPPPPEFASDFLSVASPPLPPPPDFVLEQERQVMSGKSSSGASSESDGDSVFKSQPPPQTPLQTNVNSKPLSFPQASTPQASLGRSFKIRPPRAPKPVQESSVLEILPSPIVITRQKLTTPAHVPRQGPTMAAVTPRPLSVSTQKTRDKRPSNESVDLGATPAKKIDLDISYKSTCV